MSWKHCVLLSWALAPFGGLLTYAMGGTIWLAIIEVVICAAVLPFVCRLMSGKPL